MPPRVRAPEFPKNSIWLNSSRPLTLSEFRGRLVLLDFWTYGCINCLHVLPDLKYLEQKYAEYLTVIGVHSGKFEHEQDSENIRQAIARHEIAHPVIVDRDFQIWQSYAIRAYPTIVLIDPKGYVVAAIAGEGNLKILEELIDQLVQTNEIDPQTLNLALEKSAILSPLAFPGKVVVRGDRLFISDSGHHRIIISSLNGEVLHVIGTGKAGLIDGSFSEAQFASPQGLALDGELLYVADTGNHALRKVDLEKETVITIAGDGSQNRNIYPHCGKGISLNSPWDLVLIEDRLFVAIAGSHQIWEMNLKTGILQTFAGTGAEGNFDGSIYEAAFAQPSGITTDGRTLFIADSETSSIRAIDSERVQTLCGSGSLFDFGDLDGIGETARLQHCLGVEFAHNSLWIADTYNHKIKRLNLETHFCETVLAQGFSEPSGLSATQDHLYVADTNNHRIQRIDLKSFEMSAITLKGELLRNAFPNLCAPDVCFPIKNRDIL